MLGRWSVVGVTVVGVTVVGGLWSVAGRWAVVLYYALLHGTLGFIKSYQSVNVKVIEHPQCFTFQIILWFFAILHVFVLYSHYGYSISNESLMGTTLLNLWAS